MPREDRDRDWSVVAVLGEPGRWGAKVTVMTTKGRDLGQKRSEDTRRYKKLAEWIGKDLRKEETVITNKAVS